MRETNPPIVYPHASTPYRDLQSRTLARGCKKRKTLSAPRTTKSRDYRADTIEAFISLSFLSFSLSRTREKRQNGVFHLRGTFTRAAEDRKRRARA